MKQSPSPMIMDEGIDVRSQQQSEDHRDCPAEMDECIVTPSLAQSPSPSTQEMTSTDPVKETPPPRLSLMEEYSHVVDALEAFERKLRLIHHPTLIERAAPLEVDDLRRCHEEQNCQEEQQHPKDNHREIVDPVSDSTTATISENGTLAALRKRGLREVLTIDHKILPSPFVFRNLLALDVSHNELTDLPGLSVLENLEVLDLSRNWFNTLPSEIGGLYRLSKLVAARNFLKPNLQSLRWDTLRESCPRLSVLDLRYNQKCCRPIHRDRVRESLVPLAPDIAMTLWEEEAAAAAADDDDYGASRQRYQQKNYVGSSAAQRDPVLLRSQLEPLNTVALRKRLVCDFGKQPTDPSTVDRSAVMRDLLKAYFDEDLAYFPNDQNKNKSNGETKALDYDSLVANRHGLQIYGSPVPEDKLQKLRIELEKWTAHTGLVNKNRERPSIHASNYMILRRPTESPGEAGSSINININNKPLSRRAIRKIQKRERYRSLWEAGIDALATIDPEYARTNCTEIAITHGFSGSPHRDKQNCGPFYGLSLGNYDDSDGRGGIVVEASARVVVKVNTKNRLGKVDGRYVHWVAPWGTEKHQPPDFSPSNGHSQPMLEDQPQPLKQQQQRYSLIYYETGHQYVRPGPAIFSVPEGTSTEKTLRQECLPKINPDSSPQ